MLGGVSGLAGVAYLALRVNAPAALCAAFALGLYVFVYTPLKRITALNTLVGAIPGALPPLIGWAAGSGGLGIQGWFFFALMFVWQLPHFLSIAWLYRDDYRRAGFRMLPVVEPSGVSTGWLVIANSVTLLPLCIFPTFLHMAGTLYLLCALLLTGSFVYFSLRFAIQRTDRAARWLFLASIAYLPALFAILIYDGIH